MTGNPLERLDSTVTRLREVVSAAEPTLTALDEASGDGDFGSNLDEGFARTAAIVAALADRRPWRTLEEVFLDEVGGTSGPLLGLVFHSLGTAAASEESYLDALSVGLSGGLQAVQRVGEAEPGDRTLVDALSPAVDALSATPRDAGAMVRAAIDGALSTARIRARRGRSSYVGDRAIGHPDPGAVGLALMLSVLAEPELGREAAQAERDRLLSS